MKRKSKAPFFLYLALAIILIWGLNFVISDRFFNLTSGSKIFIYILIIFLMLAFIYNEFTNKIRKRIFIIFQYLSLLAIFILCILVFVPVIDMGGDEVSFINVAESILKGKGARLLSFPDEPYMVSYLGTALTMIPLMSIFGLNIPVLKITPLILTILLLFFCYKYFRKRFSQNISMILSILVGTNVQILHMSNMLWTEIPFTCFAIAALLIIEKFDNSLKPIDGIVSGISLFWQYLVRPQGFGAIFTTPFFLLWKKIIIEKKLALGLKNFLIIAFILLLCGIFYFKVVYKILAPERPELTTKIEREKEPSVFTYALNRFKASVKNILKGVKYVSFVATEKILGDPHRATNQYFSSNRTLWQALILIILLYGYFLQIIKSPRAVDFFAIGVTIPLILIPEKGLIDTVVLSRYEFVLIPFIYYYFTYGALNLTVIFKNYSEIIKAITLCFLFIVLFINIKNANLEIYLAKKGYPEEFQIFVKTAEWVKKNLPSNSIIASRKSRNFYIYSGFKGVHYYDQTKGFSRYDRWSKELEDDTIKMYYKTVDYIVLDSFSNCAYDKVLPIIEHYPDCFSIVYVPSQFGLQENFIRTVPELLAFIKNLLQKKQIFVPTCILKVEKEKLKKYIS